jgi:hypothetical protein
MSSEEKDDIWKRFKDKKVENGKEERKILHALFLL